MIEPIVSAPLQLPTNNKFGCFFIAVFALLAAYAYVKGWDRFALAAAIAALLFASFTLIAPQLLSPLNRLWYGLGILLGKIVNPIVLGLIFFVLITPVSLVTRLFGRDELKIKKQSMTSYWVDRLPPGPAPDSFKNQF